MLPGQYQRGEKFPCTWFIAHSFDSTISEMQKQKKCFWFICKFIMKLVIILNYYSIDLPSCFYCGNSFLPVHICDINASHIFLFHAASFTVWTQTKIKMGEHYPFVWKKLYLCRLFSKLLSAAVFPQWFCFFAIYLVPCLHEGLLKVDTKGKSLINLDLQMAGKCFFLEFFLEFWSFMREFQRKVD